MSWPQVNTCRPLILIQCLASAAVCRFQGPKRNSATKRTGQPIALLQFFSPYTDVETRQCRVNTCPPTYARHFDIGEETRQDKTEEKAIIERKKMLFTPQPSPFTHQRRADLWVSFIRICITFHVTSSMARWYHWLHKIKNKVGLKWHGFHTVYKVRENRSTTSNIETDIRVHPAWWRHELTFWRFHYERLQKRICLHHYVCLPVCFFLI